MHRTPRLAFVLAWPFATLSAQPESPQAPAALAAPATPFRGVHVGLADRGTIWVRGETYKAGLGRDGVDYVPAFGSAAPRNLPVRFSLESVAIGGVAQAFDRRAAPARDAERVVYERGLLREVWHLRPTEVEQTFVLDDPGVRGDLELRIAVTSELRVERDGEGVRFSAPGLGAVEYGGLVTVDAAGQRHQHPIALRADGDLELRVPAAELATTVFPLLLDPVVTTLAFDTSALQDSFPDAAYDLGTDQWYVVYQERFSGQDSDIRCRRYAGDGAFLSDFYFDASAASDTQHPKIANQGSSGEFLAVWEERVVGDVRGGLVTAGLTQPLALPIAAPPSSVPDVGGATTRNGIEAKFFVAWKFDTFLKNEIRARTVSRRGSGNARVLDADVNCGGGGVTVSKTADASGRWSYAYQHRRTCASQANDIAFGVVDQDGAPVFGPTLVQSASGEDTDPDIATDGETHLVIFVRKSGNQHDLIGTGYRQNGANYLPVFGPANLSQREPGVVQSDDQVAPAVDSDGCRFVYAYNENRGSSTDLRAATLLITPTSFAFHEGHVKLASAASVSLSVASAGSSGGPTARAMICWGTISPQDIQGVLFDAMAPGGIRFVATGCGLVPPTLTVTGSALGQTLSASMSHRGLPFLLVGLPASRPSLLCQPVTSQPCQLGLGTIALSTATNSLQLNLPCNPALVGGTIALQGIDVGTKAACAAFGVPLSTTDTAHITVQ